MAAVTLDTNIIVSALNFGGPPFRLLEKAIAGDVQVAVSQPIIDELRRVLRETFEWSDDRLNEAQSLIKSYVRQVAPTQTLDAVRMMPLITAIGMRSSLQLGVRHHR